MDRKCNTCNYKPCTRAECNDNGECIYQKFPHEVLIEDYNYDLDKEE